MLTLKHPYISVEKDGIITYGGSQTRSESKAMRRCGCGVIGGLDLVIYLLKYHDCCRSDIFPPELLWDVIRLDAYDDFAQKLSRSLLPIVPPIGMNGLTLMMGVKLLFRRYNIPMNVRWGVRRSELWNSIEEMLADDIPVILSIGPNFPKVWQKNKTALYKMQGDERPRVAASTHSHFLTVTGLDEEWLQVSSWGSRFYISRTEFEEYVTRHSNGILSSILYVSRK